MGSGRALHVGRGLPSVARLGLGTGTSLRPPPPSPPAPRPSARARGPTSSHRRLARWKSTLSPVTLGRKTVLWLNRSEGPSACSHSAWPMPSPTPPRDFHGPLRHPAVAFTSTGNQFSSTFISPSSAATPSTLLHPSGGLQPKYNGKPDSNRFKLTGSSLLHTTRSPKLKRFQD